MTIYIEFVSRRPGVSLEGLPGNCGIRSPELDYCLRIRPAGTENCQGTALQVPKVASTGRDQGAPLAIRMVYRLHLSDRLGFAQLSHAPLKS